MIRIRETGTLVTEQEFREMHPEKSFPSPLRVEDLDECESDIVFDGPMPIASEHQTVVPDGARQIGGNWHTAWAVQDWPQERIDAYETDKIASKQRDYTTALEEMYDGKARDRHYDNRFTCALRAGYAGPFQADGTAFAVWMDTCNATAYGIMAKVLAGEMQYPTKEELLGMMPELVWPA